MNFGKLIAKEFRRLAKDMDRLQKAINKAASDAAVDGAVDVVGKLAWNTPVDTSKALSNWQASAGFPKTREIPAHFLGDAGSTKAMSAAETADRAREALARKKPGQQIFITNNVSYMEFLADGYPPGSPQQPSPGWIEAIGRISEKQWKFKYPVL